MLISYAGNSNRVKGICFHPRRPWLLTSLHNGAIQLWDYRMKTLLDQFTEHEGPVRGIDFHKTQPLFVSGGDDYKIKVWNYKLRRCLFTLQGHLDYIRTVEFHMEQPWIVSASDDYTIRIWNWQSRQCIAVLTGHNYYVMSASFHPTEDLLVSASLDQTVRVWDTSGLKKSGRNMSDDFMRMNQLNQDLFGTNDVMVKYILEGHERGVNWASFHPTQNYIISAADDKTVRLWKYNDTRAWEADVLVGHSNNVSCAKFHAKKGLIVSNSEDKTIRIYNMNKNNSFLQSYQRENDRFWILTVHPNQNLMAAGHDNGFVIFKLERERPPFVTIKNQMYFVKDKYLRKYDCEKNADIPIAMLKRSVTTTPRVLQYNSQENLALIVSGVGEHATWELFAFQQTSNKQQQQQQTQPQTETNLEQTNPSQKGKGVAAVFVGLKKFAVLSSNKLKIQLKQVDKEVTKEMDAPVSPLENIFQATSGRILLKSDEKVYLFDFEQQSIIAQVSAPNVRNVVWSDDGSRAALLSKHSLIIVNSKLEVLCSLKETVAIKSGAFDEVGVFLYTTLNHLKYCLPNGDYGTIKTLLVPYYIAKVRNNGIHIIDRESNVHLTFIDATEYRFKLALLSGKTHEIKSIIGQSKILGDSIIAYLEQKGYPNIAMKFVQDDQTKFDLALKSGNIEQALQAAMNLDKKENWNRLGWEALEQGNSVQIVERAYQKTKEFEKLSFLYLLLGSNSYLQKMLQIAQKREDTMSRFHNALLLGNVETRIKILMENNQWALAYASAKQHGLTDLAQQCQNKIENLEEIEAEAEQQQVVVVENSGELLLPPIPVYTTNNQNWPKLNTFAMQAEEDVLQVSVEDHDLEETGNWEGIQIPTAQDELLQEEGKPSQQKEEGEEEETVGGWEGLEEITDVEHLNSAASVSHEQPEDFSAPNEGRSLAQYWIENSISAVDHIAAGHFDSACQLLTNTFGVTQFGPLKPLFQNVYMGSRCVMPITPLQPCISILLQRNMIIGDNEENKNNSLPMIAGFDLNDLTEKSKTALKTVTLGKFEDAQKMFREVMHQLLFVNLPSKKDEREARDLLKVCSEYTAALRLEIIRNSLKNSDPKKSAELAAYFTKCKLNSSHIMLILNSAMSVNLKIENYATAALFAKRLLSMGPIPKLADQAKFVIQKAEQNPQDKYELNYDDRNPFVVCCHSLTPIYAGSESISCSYCGAPYLPKYKGETCTVCEIADIGKQVPGLQVFKPIKTQ